MRLACVLALFFALLCGVIFLPTDDRRQAAGPLKSELQVGVVLYTGDDAFLNEMMAAVRKEIDDLNTGDWDITLVERNAGNSQSEENEIVSDMINEGCDILLVNLVDRNAPARVIETARENNVPIVFFNRELVRNDMGLWNRLYYVGGNAAESGELQGELAAALCESNPGVDRNKDGKIQYAVLQGEPNHQDAIIRTDMAVSTMADRGIVLDKLSYRIANWSRSQAKTQTLQLISAYGSSVELILANNDEMALGAIDAYRQMNYTETDMPKIFGIDGTSVGLSAVADGSLDGTVYNDKEAQGKALVNIAITVARGGDLSAMHLTNGKYYYADYYAVTAENVSDYLKQ